MIRVVHVISSLDTGGSEAALYKLLARLNRSRFESRVISLTTVGEVGRKIESLGIDVQSLDMRRGIPSLGKVAGLLSRFRAWQPDLVQTWMYHADLIGGVAARITGRPAVVWNIRHSNLDPCVNKRSTLWVAKACARLSRRVPTRIVACSERSRAIHAEIGYDDRRMLVIPNGFDVQQFRPDVGMYQDVRRELGLAEGTVLVGLVGRFHPQKDHRCFVEAAALVHREFPEVRFVLCGEGVTWTNLELSAWIRERGLDHSVDLLGRRPDMGRLNAAFDVATLSSLGEGFPNVIGEAMACGVPCVVTDVGGSRELVGDTGVIVPPHEPAALASGIKQLLEIGPLRRRALGQRARERVTSQFGVDLAAEHYASLYASLVVDPALGKNQSRVNG